MVAISSGTSVQVSNYMTFNQSQKTTWLTTLFAGCILCVVLGHLLCVNSVVPIGHSICLCATESTGKPVSIIKMDANASSGLISICSQSTWWIRISNCQRNTTLYCKAGALHNSHKLHKRAYYLRSKAISSLQRIVNKGMDLVFI